MRNFRVAVRKTAEPGRGSLVQAPSGRRSGGGRSSLIEDFRLIARNSSAPKLVLAALGCWALEAPPLAAGDPAPPIAEGTTTNATAIPSAQPVENLASNRAANKNGTGTNSPIQLETVIVTGDLDAAREQIAPSLGAGTYKIGLNQIQAMAQGENASFQQVLLQAPGVVEDEFGEVHIRGDHGDVQYRVNGVLLPEGLNGFGQEIDTRLIKSVTLITGALPAQFGFRTAGIVDVATKTGDQLNGAELSLYGGSYDTFHPSLEFGGATNKFEYFFTASYLHDDLGIDNTTSSPTPLHDVTGQEKAFGLVSYAFDPTSRLSLLLNASYADFEIPDSPGLSPRFQLTNAPAANSSAVNENQNEQNYYAVLSYQKSVDKYSLQVSAFTRETGIRFEPDSVQDLLFSGLAGRIDNGDFANGAQADASYALGEHNTLRAGGLATYDEEKLDTATAVFPVNAQGQQTSTTPYQILENSRNNGALAGAYLQDEWRLSDRLTLNFGARYDRFDVSFDHEGQLSPRLNLVWNVDDATTAHVGGARYFMPPTLQYISPAAIKEFEGTSNAPFNERDDAPKCERDYYFDAGISREIMPKWQITLDSFWKLAKNLLDDGQFGNAVILNNFNYTDGSVYGAELSSTYKQGAFSAYGNFSYVQTWAQNVDSAEFEFPNNELAYIASRDIQLDHQGRYTASAGASYVLLKNTRFYASMMFGDGLRAGFANLDQLPSYYPFNVGVEHVFHLKSRFAGISQLKLRFDCLNVFDQVYELRNGTGLGIAAPAFGPRRAFYGGLTAVF
jgi:outer membrane receptor protein involved in Fe transport